MTAVIDIPDDLYKKMTERVASLGRRVPDVTVELYERWLVEEKRAVVRVAHSPSNLESLEQWFRAADEAMSHAPVGQSARELLMEDRNRLEHS